MMESVLSIQEKYLFLQTFSKGGRRRKWPKNVLSHDAGITQLVE